MTADVVRHPSADRSLDALWTEFLGARQVCLDDPSPERGIVADKAFGTFVTAVAAATPGQHEAFLARKHRAVPQD